MLRFFYFLALIIIPVLFSWWLFIPLVLLAVYLIKLPYEIIIAGFILDLVYYFGDGFIAKHLLVMFSFLVLSVALFLNSKVHWRKII
ncbi:MAG: hypothetical protein AAB446_01085 [Patescibacteria group bacterium]